MKKNVILYTPDGKRNSYTNVQHLKIDERGILSFANARDDKTIVTTLPFMIVEREKD